MKAGDDVFLPDGRMGVVLGPDSWKQPPPPGAVWVTAYQRSNVNRTELFKAEALRVDTCID